MRLDTSLSARRRSLTIVLFLAVTINYLDRQVFATLAPTLQASARWSEITYAYIQAAFKIAYAIGYSLSGALVDRFGVRLVYGLAFTAWTAIAAGHAFVRSAAVLAGMRAGLGLAEAANFPAVAKTIAMAFGEEERSSVMGWVNAGSNVGVVLAAMLVPLISVRWGPSWAFLLTAAGGLFWLPLWFRVAPRDQTAAPAPSAGATFRPVRPSRAQWMRRRETWAFVVAKLATDPIWWFWLGWSAKFLAERHHLSLTGLALPLVVVYSGADLGSILGGRLPARLTRRARISVTSARQIALAACALAVVPVAAVPYVDAPWIAVGLLTLACAAHQAWSANLMTVPADLFPSHVVGSVVGLAGTAGALGGFFFDIVVGHVLERTGRYSSLFLYASGSYAAAFTVLHLLIYRRKAS